jgi:hypothetical protein
MGGLLFIGLILTVYLATKKYNEERRTVNPENSPSPSTKKIPINMTLPEINLLFPIFKRKDI